MITLPRVAARIFGEPLAISREKLEVIVTAVGPRLQGMPLDDPEEVAGRQPAAVDPDGIATIDICGTLVAKASGMGAMSGLTSYADIAADFQAAIANPQARGILLAIDSPGGEVNGMFDLADMMAQARGQKPILAVVNCAASAAYLLASTADQIIVSRTGITGSIGIIALHLDQSQADEKAGLKYTSTYAGARKNDGNPHQPLSPEAQSSMQGRVDTIYGMFTAAVARNRGMEASAIRDTEAAVYMGQDGVNVGLADSVGTAADAARLLSAAIQSGSKSLYASSAAGTAKSTQEQRMPEVNAATAETKQPTAAEIEALVAEARTAGFTAATEIVELCALAGMPAKAAEFITAQKSVKDVRAALMTARVEADQQATAGRELSTAVTPGVDAGKQEPQGKAKPWGDVLKALGFKKGEK